MYKIFIAFRYLISRPISLVSIIGIFLSVGALIVVVSVMSGFLRDTKAFIRGTMSDLVITPKRYVRTFDGQIIKLNPSFDKVQKAIRDVPGVTGVAPRLVRPALITKAERMASHSVSSNSDFNFVKVLGIDQAQEREVSDLNKLLQNVHDKYQVDRLDDPFYLSDENKEAKYFACDYPSILVGNNRFIYLGLTKGSVVTLATIDESVLEKGGIGQEKTVKAYEKKFFLAGAFSSGNHQFDMQYAIIDMKAGWDWVDVENEINEVYVSVEDYETRGIEIKESIIKVLKKHNYAADVETWEERNEVFLGAVENERTILGVILAFFILIATFNVYATISMMVTDKTKDIGILVSMGATSYGIMTTFVLCGLFMWLIGSILGSIGGYLFANNINSIKDFIEDKFNIEVFNSNVYNFKEIPVEISVYFIGIIIVGTFFMCLFFSLLPALRASLMNPVKALRHE